MTTSETKLYYIPYDVLRKNKGVPKSFFGFLWWLLRSIGRGIIRNFPKNLLIPIILILIYMMINIVYMGIVNDTMYFNNTDKSIQAYIFSGFVVVGDGIKGFDYFSNRNDVRSIYWTMPMLFLLTGLIRNLFIRIRQNGFKKLVQDITGAGNTARLYAKASTKSIGSHILFGCFLGSILGLLLQSPIILFLLPIILFLSFTLRENSKLIGIVSMFLISINIKRKKPKYVNIANLALGVYGLAIGFAFYFLVIIILWFVVNYNIYARVIFTTIIAVTTLLLYKTKSNKTIAKTSLMIVMMITAFAIFSLTNFVIYADDGGWSESGKNLVGWLSNPGTKLLALLGLEAGAGTALGWLADTALGGILPALGLGEAMTVLQVLCGAGSPTDLGFAALGTALGPLGPLGSAIGDAWKGSIDALAGSEGGVTGGKESTSGSSNSSGSSGPSGSNTGNSGNPSAGTSGDSGSSSSPSSSTSGDSGSSSDSSSSSTSGDSGSSSDSSNTSGDSGSSSDSPSSNTSGDSGSSSDSPSSSTNEDSSSNSDNTSSSTEANSDSTTSQGTGRYGYPRGNSTEGTTNGQTWKDRLEELDEEEKKRLLGGDVDPEENDSN